MGTNLPYKIPNIYIHVHVHIYFYARACAHTHTHTHTGTHSPLQKVELNSHTPWVRAGHTLKEQHLKRKQTVTFQWRNLADSTLISDVIWQSFTYKAMRRALHRCGLPSKTWSPSPQHEKIIKQVRTEGCPTTYPQIPQNCQGHEKQGEEWEITGLKSPRRNDN